MFTELDNQDQDRVYAGFALQNIRDSVDRIKGWLEAVGKSHVSEHDLTLYGLLLDAEKEDSDV